MSIYWSGHVHCILILHEHYTSYIIQQYSNIVKIAIQLRQQYIQSPTRIYVGSREGLLSCICTIFAFNLHDYVLHTYFYYQHLIHKKFILHLFHVNRGISFSVLILKNNSTNKQLSGLVEKYITPMGLVGELPLHDFSVHQKSPTRRES